MTDQPVRHEYYESLERRLRDLDALVIELVPDLSGWYRKYLDAGEYGLAVEIIAEELSSGMPKDRLRELASALLSEAELMGSPDSVSDHLRELV